MLMLSICYADADDCHAIDIYMLDFRCQMLFRYFAAFASYG